MQIGVINDTLKKNNFVKFVMAFTKTDKDEQALLILLIQINIVKKKPVTLSNKILPLITKKIYNIKKP